MLKDGDLLSEEEGKSRREWEMGGWLGQKSENVHCCNLIKHNPIEQNPISNFLWILRSVSKQTNNLTGVSVLLMYISL